MSLEQAILELAAAMKEQAAAQRESNEVQRATAAGYEKAAAGYEKAVTAYGMTFAPVTEGAVVKRKGTLTAEAVGKAIEQVADSLEKPATEEVAADMRDAKDADMRDAKDAELETAVQQVEQAVQEEAAPLDYKADVRPVLLALNKAKGADALKGLLGKYGAATGDKLDAEHYAAIVADAKALIG